MKFPRLLAVLCPLVFATALSAQSTVTTERTVQAPTTAVETRTVVTADGTTVTERVTTTTQREREAVSKTYTAAVVVSNRAASKYDHQIPVLEDLLAARLSDLGFNLVSREIVTSGLRAFAPPGSATDLTSSQAAASAEAAFLDQSSALRLAQNLGADYLLHASITSFTNVVREAPSYSGERRVFNDLTLRVAYKVIDAQSGATLSGGDARSEKSERAGEFAADNVDGILANLLDDATRQITASLRTRIAAGRITAPKAAAKLVTITLAVEAADLFIPDVRIGAENVVSVGESKFKVTPLNATVEVDGVAVGTAPGKITLKPGFSRLRLSREGFETWERTINATDGQTLSVALAMTPAGLARFKESTSWINELKNGAKLTDGEVKVLEGKAKSLENSFFKVDTKENFRFILPEGYRDVQVNQQNTPVNN